MDAEDDKPNANVAAAETEDERARIRRHAKETEAVLDLKSSGTRIWLVKVPDFVAEKWNEINESGESGVDLGTLRVEQPENQFEYPNAWFHNATLKHDLSSIGQHQRPKYRSNYRQEQNGIYVISRKHLRNVLE
jgi:hypothetical protein